MARQQNSRGEVGKRAVGPIPLATRRVGGSGATGLEPGNVVSAPPTPSCARCTATQKLLSHRAELSRMTGELDKGHELYRRLYEGYLQLEQDMARFKAAAEGKPLEVPAGRRKLPDERKSVTWHLRIGDKATGVSPHVHVGFGDDGKVLELFIEVDDADKDRIGAMADAAATAFSIALQYGCPLKDMAEKWLGLHGGVRGAVWTLAEEPPELTAAQARQYVAPMRRDRESWSCTSLLDLVARKLLVRYCGRASFAPEGVDK